MQLNVQKNSIAYWYRIGVAIITISLFLFQPAVDAP